jgi:hypothetical protein
MQPAGLVFSLSVSVNKEAWLHVLVFQSMSRAYIGMQKMLYTLPVADTLPKGPF